MRRLCQRSGKAGTVLLLLLLAITPSGADDLGGSLLRDYPVALTIPKGRLEISLDYLAADESLQAAGLNTDPQAAGDMQGLRLLVNYGLQRRTTLLTGFTYRDQAFGADRLTIMSADLMLQRNLLNHRLGWAPRLSVGAGLRGNFPLNDESLLMTPISETNVSTIALTHLQDFTPYARITTGKIWGRLFPNLYLEYGYSSISGQVEPGIPGRAPQDLGRNETYLKSGLNLLIKFPYRALWRLEYSYTKFFRGASLDRVDDNQLFMTDFSYYLTPSIALTLGVCYSMHQLVGQVPFLYQEFSQESFRKSFGSSQVGITFLFGGKQR